MSMEIKGKIIQLLPLQTGMGKKGQWKKQDFVIETPGQYPKKVCLSLWGDKVDQYKVASGDVVTVTVDLESREYNGRWYTEARAWKLEKNGAQGDVPPPPADDPYFNQEPRGADSGDDIPF